MCTKNIKNSTLPFIPSEKMYAFLSLGTPIKQWHATSVAGVQIVGTAQKDLSRKNREGVASFLPFFFPRSPTFFPSLSDHSTI